MRKALVFLLGVIAAATAFFSCDSTRVFDSYQEVPESAWHKDSLFTFSIPVTDTIRNHNLFIQIRNETSYKYSNLWLFIEIIQPGGEIMRDTFEIVLADPSGRWLGKGIGGLKTLQSVYRRNTYFPVPGDYNISLQHGMRDEILTGIHDVGIRVEKVTGRE